MRVEPACPFDVPRLGDLFRVPCEVCRSGSTPAGCRFKAEGLLHKAEKRTVEELWDAIGRLIDTITSKESANFFEP